MSSDRSPVGGVCDTCGVAAVWTVGSKCCCFSCGAGDYRERSIEQGLLCQLGSCTVVLSGLDNHGEALRPFGQLEISMESDGPRGPCASARVSVDMSAQDMRRLADLLIEHAARLDQLHEQIETNDLAS